MSGRRTAALVGAVAVAAGLFWRTDGRPAAAPPDPGGVVLGDPHDPPRERVTAAGFTSDGWHVVTGTRGGELQLRDADRGGILRRWTGHDRAVNAVACLPGGRGLVSAGMDGRLRWWDTTADPPVVRADVAADGPIHALAAATDGRTVAAGAAGRVALWHIADEGLRPGPGWPTDGLVAAVAFPPDGRTLAVGDSADGRVRLIPLAGGADEWLDGSDEYRVRGLQFRPADGALLAVTTDGAVLRWPAARPAVGRLPGRSVRQAALSPDGRRAILADLDGPARLAAVPGG
jgi:WD40 repeat protein